MGNEVLNQSTPGVHQVAVPAGVTAVTITVVGADGGPGDSSQGGQGATIEATFPVTPGDLLRAIVGAAGAPYTAGGSGTCGGGGGGTAIINVTAASQLLIVAGAGAGGENNFNDGDPAGGGITECGSSGSGSQCGGGNCAGGCGGSGGRSITTTGGGGGALTAGEGSEGGGPGGTMGSAGVEWDEQQEPYPVVFDSVGTWDADSSVTPPEGFVSDYDTLTEHVDNELEAVQFLLTDIGSDWVPTETRHVLRHQGRREVVLSRIGVRLSESLAQAKGLDRDGHPLGPDGRPRPHPGFDPRGEWPVEIVGWIEPSAVDAGPDDDLLAQDPKASGSSAGCSRGAGVRRLRGSRFLRMRSPLPSRFFPDRRIPIEDAVGIERLVEVVGRLRLVQPQVPVGEELARLYSNENFPFPVVWSCVASKRASRYNGG